MCELDRQESFYLKKSSDTKARIKIDNSEETESMLTKINGYKKKEILSLVDYGINCFHEARIAYFLAKQ